MVRRLLLSGAFFLVLVGGVLVGLPRDTIAPWGGAAEARTAVLSGGVVMPVGGGGGPASPAAAPGPGGINFQGRLTDPGTGNAVADGTYNINFAIYDAASGGTELWSTSLSPTVTGGLFNVDLAEADSFPAGLFESSPRYLEVGVPPDPPMTPRLAFLSVPYAFHADVSDVAMDAADVNCTECVHPSDVEFSYAGSASQGGAASDVECFAPAGCVSGNEIIDSAVTSADIASDTITGFDIAFDTITSSDIAFETITTNDIAFDTITASDIASNAIGSAEIVDSSVASADIAPDTIASADIALDTIQGADIASSAVGSAEIADSNITGADISDAAGVASIDVVDNSLTSSDVAINYAGSTSEGGIANDAQLLDSIDSGSFLRSDTSDSFTSGTLTFSPGTILHLQGFPASPTLRLSSSGGDGDQRICFFEGISCGEGLMWSDTNNRFEFSDDLHSSGGVTASTLSTSNTITVAALGSAGATTLCRNASNEIATCSSSARYKDDVVSLAFDGEKLLALRPVEFRWKESGEPGVGLVAEEVAAVLPELVTYNDRGEVEGVRYEQLTVYLLELLKQHEKELAELKGGADVTTAAATTAGGLGATQLAIVIAAAVAAAVVISGGTTLVVLRATRSREAMAS
jgi:hypothetical protein